MSRMMMNLKGLSALCLPQFFYSLDNKLKRINKLKSNEIERLRNRLNYYNKINNFFTVEKVDDRVSLERLGDNLLKNTSYSFDFYKVGRYFSKDFFVNKFFYDCGDEFNKTITKSRPIGSNNILLKLDSRRHFCFLKDNVNYENKLDLAVFRGACYQQNRIDFMNKFKNNPILNIADTKDYRQNGGGI